MIKFRTRLDRNIPINKLLIINYSLDESDPLLAHQLAAVQTMATKFDSVHVITGHRGTGFIPENVIIRNIEWRSGSKIKKIFHLLKV